MFDGFVWGFAPNTLLDNGFHECLMTVIIIFNGRVFFANVNYGIFMMVLKVFGSCFIKFSRVPKLGQPPQPSKSSAVGYLKPGVCDEKHSSNPQKPGFDVLWYL